MGSHRSVSAGRLAQSEEELSCCLTLSLSREAAGRRAEPVRDGLTDGHRDIAECRATLSLTTGCRGITRKKYKKIYI